MSAPNEAAAGTTAVDDHLPNLEKFGVWTEPDVFEVTREHIAAYAAATNDPTPAHVAGDVAGPIFAVIPAWRTAFPLLLSTLSPELQLRTLHGEQDIILNRPLRPGMTLHTTAAIIGVRSSRTGTTLTAHASSVTPHGEKVIDQYTTLFVKGVTMDDRGDVAPPRLAVSESADVSEQTATDRLDPDQTVRYSVAAQDDERIHLDPEVAAAAGFPGLINHGNCTFAIAARRVLDVACDGDVRRLRRISVRFSRAVLLDEEITTTVWVPTTDPTATAQADDRNNLQSTGRVVSWQSALRSGDLCLKNGYAELVSD